MEQTPLGRGLEQVGDQPIRLFVIRGAQQRVVFRGIGHFDLDDPAFAVGVLVDDCGVGVYRVVEFDDFTADGQESVADGLHGFD